jgi:hypothetical protein
VALSDIVTVGFGTFSGVEYIPTRGFDIGVAAEVTSVGVCTYRRSGFVGLTTYQRTGIVGCAVYKRYSIVTASEAITDELVLEDGTLGLLESGGLDHILLESST